MSTIRQAGFLTLSAIKLSIFILATLIAAMTANAEGLMRGETVVSRERPELDPLGVRIGSFLLYPDLTIGLRQEDNIFAVESNTVSDLITLINPAVKLKSDWNNHTFGLLADFVAARYSENPDEDYQDYTVEGDGRLDISRNSALSGALQYAHLHEARTSPDDARGLTPTKYTASSIFISYNKKFDRLSVQIDGWQQKLDYKSVPTSAGILNNDDRDRVENLGTLRFNYVLMPGYQMFLRGSVNSRKYAQRFDRFGLKRNSNGSEVVAGAALDFSGVTFGEIYIGYLRQNYEEPRFSDIGEPTFGGEITWNPSGLTTVTGTAGRSIKETTFDNASGIHATSFELGVDHELWRNLILHMDMLGERDDYQGLNRKDDVFVINLGGKYMLNRNLYVLFGYDYERRVSEPPEGGGRNYKINSYTLRVEGQI